MLKMFAGTMVGEQQPHYLLKSNLRWLLIACFVFFSAMG
jgi:hypothetical protein